jgi:hypothetical protein
MSPITAQAANPYLPLWEHVPDAEPHLFNDPDNMGQKRVYIYGSHDLVRTAYCAYDIVSWSAPETDVTDWRYEGPAYTFVRNNNNLPVSLYAPDCAEVKRKVELKSGIYRGMYQDNQKLASSDYNDRKYDEYPVFYDKKNDCGFIFDYYLYPHPNGIVWVIAHSKGSPTGPFDIVNADANSNRLAVLADGTTAVNNGFDPGVVVDTDADGYATAAYLWGGGFNEIAACKLNMDNMASPEFDQALADQDTTGKYNSNPASVDYGVKRNFLPVVGVSSYDGDAHAWSMENNINPDDPTKNKFDVLDPENLNLYMIFEASSPRKIGNKWVFSYAGNAGSEYGVSTTVATLKYAYSDNPLGPWKYGGVLVDARGPQLDENGNMITTNLGGNTHGGLVEANNQWYIFYHRCINQHQNSRQHMAEPVYVKADAKPVAEGGSVVITGYDPESKSQKVIKDVNGNIYTGAEVTSSGTELDGLNPYKYYSAGLANWVTPEGGTDFTTYIQATYDMHEDAAPILNVRDSSIMGYKYFNFNAPKPAGKSTTLDMYLVPKGVDFTVDIMMDTPWSEGTPNAGIKLGELSVPADAKQVKTKYTVSVPALDDVKGRHGIYFVCRSGDTAQENFQFTGFAFGRQNVLLADSFANLNNWVGSGATVPGGVLTLAANADLTSKRGSDWQDYEFSADIKSITGAIGVQFMKSAANKYYELAIADDGAMKLNSVSAGGNEELAQAAAGAFSAPASVSVSAADGVIKVRIDGVLVMRAENSDYDSGAIGFATGAGEAAEIDNVLVIAATDKEIATSEMKIMVDGASVPLPNSIAATASNAYTDVGNYDFTYAHSNPGAPNVTATCSDKNVKVSVTQPMSATDMAIVRADKGGYTKIYRIKLAKGKTVTGTINPQKGGAAYPDGAAQDIIDDIMAGEDLTGNWRLDLAVMVDKAPVGRNGFNAGTKVGVGVYDSANNYYQVSAQRHSTATNLTAANAGVSYVNNGSSGSANSSQAFPVDFTGNTMTYNQMLTYNMRLTKTGNAVLGSLNNNSITYSNVGSAQTFEASVFDTAKVQLFATNTTANRDLTAKYVATLITEDYVNPNTISSATGTIAPEKNGRPYGNTAKAADDIKPVDLSNIAPEILAGDWAATVAFTTVPTLQTGDSNIQVGIGMSAAVAPERNFFQVHMNRNGTANNNVGGVTYANNSATSVNDNSTPSTAFTSTLATHTVRLTKIGNTLRGAYITSGTTYANIGGTLATKFPEEFFKDATLNVFASNGTSNDFAVSNYTVSFAPLKSSLPVSYDQLAVEDAAYLIGNGIAVTDSISGADDKARAQSIIDGDTRLIDLGVTCTVNGAATGPNTVTISKGSASQTIAPFTVLNVTNKGWAEFDTLKNTTIAGLNEADYTRVSWNRLQKALASVVSVSVNSDALAIGLAYDKLDVARAALEAAGTEGVITADGLNDGGYTKADSVAVTATQTGGDTISTVTLDKNGAAVSPSGYIASGLPFNVVTTDEGLYYIEATTVAGRTSDFSFTVDKTAPVISYDAGAEKLTISDDNLAFVTINGQAIAVNGKIYSAKLTTDKYEVSAEDKAGNTAVYTSAATDKTELAAAVDEALKKMFSDSLINYTTGTAGEFRNALYAAQALNQDLYARQIDIDKAAARLVKAMANLVSRVTLKDAIDQAESLDLNNYMQYQVRYQIASGAGNSNTNLVLELENSKMMYERPNYSPAMLSWAENRLRTIMNQLVSRVPLRVALANANGILTESSKYTSTSINALQTAVNTATTFYDRRTNATAANVTTEVNRINTAISALVSKGDKVQLDASIAKAEAENGALYTDASWSALQTALTAAKAVSGDVAQSVLDTALNNLNDAISALVLKGDKVQLKAVIVTAEARVATLYTTDTWTRLQTALTAAKLVDTNANAAQPAIDGAALALSNAIADLELKVNKTVLSAAINTANTVDANLYTDATVQALNAAKIAANTVNSNAAATQAEVDAAVNGLFTAITALAPKDPAVDKSVLTDVLANADTINPDEYTDASYALLKAAIDEGQAILDKANATQAEVDAAVESIAYNMTKLVVRGAEIPVYRAVLSDVLAIFNSLSFDADKYTEDSYAPLKTAMDAAQEVLNNASATQAEIDAAVKSIVDNISKLAPRPLIVQLPGTETVNTVVQDSASTVAPEAASTVALDAAIVKAQIINRVDYTAVSLARVDSALKVAQDIKAQNPAKDLQAVVDSVVFSLNNAIDALVEVAPKVGTIHSVGNLKYKVTASSDGLKTVAVTGQVNKNKTVVTIPSKVTVKGYEFRVTAVADNAFKNNKKITTVTIGSYVTSIGKSAFRGCAKLKIVKVKTKTLNSVGTLAFKGIKSNASIKVPASKLKVYKVLMKGKGQSEKVRIRK